MFQNFMSEKIAGQGDNRPFLVLPGIKGMRPYNPSRVMRQFGRREITPVQGDASSFVIDYNRCINIHFAKTIHQEWDGWVNMKGSIAENRCEVGYVDEYKNWL